MTTARERRGRETQEAAAAYWRQRGWKYATSAGSGVPGVDVLNLPGVACEVKARRELRLKKWLEQAEGYPGFPLVVHRPDGMGLATVELWPATFRFRDAVTLINYFDGGGCLDGYEGGVLELA